MFKQWAVSNVRIYEPIQVPPFISPIPAEATPETHYSVHTPSTNGNGPTPTSPALSVNLTDLGNARRLIYRHGHLMRYCYPWRKWLVWDGARWAIDETAAAERLAKDTVQAFYDEAMHTSDLEVRQRLLKHAIKSEGAANISNMLSLARSEEGTPVLTNTLDRNRWLFNCLNGTLDLKSMTLRSPDQADLITQLSPVPFDPSAECPLWLTFLDRVMNGNTSLMSFLKRAIGYALTGETSEQVLFFLYGIGRNGKSTFVETIRAVLGDYAQQMPSDSLMMKHSSSGNSNDIARLRGARFAVSMETEEGRRMAESMVKQLTGGDRISARFLHAEFFEFDPTHKLFLCTNHKPIIRGTDNAIWRRIRLIPFSVIIPLEDVDPELKSKLLREAPGILRWAVEGCIEWQKNGLGCPIEVEEATDEYRKEMDVLGDFLNECFEIVPMMTLSASEIYKTYKDWCEDGGEFCLSQTKFGKSMNERGFEKKRREGGLFYVGLVRKVNNTEY